MSLITEQKDLDSLCQSLSREPYILVDTEFLRDKTYYPRLCLVQLAAPGGKNAVGVDPLVKDLDLKPLYDLLSNEAVVKVFHAARQDLEIFYMLTGKMPHPVFDTQVAAMVCGYGESIGYVNLVADICNKRLDKSSQFTDWSRRPLSEKQMVYALDDVIFLDKVYARLAAELGKEGRAEWVQEEMDWLTDPTTYDNPPEQAWKRIKLKSASPEVLSVLQKLAAWREEQAQKRDLPRNRIIRDETLVDIAVHQPQTVEDLKKIRNIGGDVSRPQIAEQVVGAIKAGLAVPPGQRPRLQKRENFPQNLIPTLELLKMLLRIQAAKHKVAPKLVAETEELEELAQNPRATPLCMKGWRHVVFGAEAEKLMAGKIALTLKGGQITTFDIAA